MYDQILVIWISDSSGLESIHRNGTSLSAKDSKLGHLERRRDVDGDWSWGYVLKNLPWVPQASYARARKELEKKVLEILVNEPV